MVDSVNSATDIEIVSALDVGFNVITLSNDGYNNRKPTILMSILFLRK